MSRLQTGMPLRRKVLAAAEWQALAAAHRDRAREWTGPMRERRARGVKHPVFDFLNTYYHLSLGRLERWEPGPDLVLEDCAAARRCFPERQYRFTGGTCALDPARLGDKERRRLGFMLQLLLATRDRAPNFACHGMHEWAMVYRGAAVRHRETAPLRLRQDEIDALVESRPLCCSHHDAFRFFAPDARPLNRFAPTLESREAHEQAGCLHVNMDLYKWSTKAMPWVGSALRWECFQLALRSREIDMRASPYDLAGFGYEPIAVETPTGRDAYEAAQRAVAAEARIRRDHLVGSLQIVLAASEAPDHIRADADGPPPP